MYRFLAQKISEKPTSFFSALMMLSQHTDDILVATRQDVTAVRRSLDLSNKGRFHGTLGWRGFNISDKRCIYDKKGL